MGEDPDQSGSDGQLLSGEANKEASARLVYKNDFYENYLPDDEGQEVFDDGTYDDELEADEQEAKLAIRYKPFTPEKDLKEIRSLSEEEQTLTPEEQAKIRRTRLENFKAQLEAQRAGISGTIQSLYTKIQNEPDASKDEFWQIVTDVAEQYKFNYGQLLSFNRALEEYIEKHRAVERNRAQYPDDAQLFTACFGIMPGGNVYVVKGAMTLMFRCWDHKDYAAVYSHKKDVSSKIIAAANQTAGVALYNCEIEELAGTITAENGLYLPRKKRTRKGGNHDRALCWFLPAHP